MDPSTIKSQRDAIASEHGPWVAYNIRLADGVYTMSNNHVGSVEFLIHAIVQAVSDLSAKPLDQLRILDLGCHEGGYAIEFGLHGATVVGIEGRIASVEKARFAAEALGLDKVTFLQGDVRELKEEDLGRFDVVLCLGILYHLEVKDAVELVDRCYALCDELTVVRSAIWLSQDVSTVVNGHVFEGRRYRENTHEGASLDNPTSILPSRTSLLNLLADVGFTSVFEVEMPNVPGLDEFVDNATYMAMRGGRVPFRSIDGIDDILSKLRRAHRGRLAPLKALAIPQQGGYWRVRERVMHSVAKNIFQSRKPTDTWRVPPRG
jgi:2-polyprenyl-3-methyl-5-hydroxy-6-metoxy-1,4-benzoquinol methylase